MKNKNLKHETITTLLRYMTPMTLRVQNKEETTMVDSEKTNKNAAEQNVTHLPCGCIYQDVCWMLMRVNECKYHYYKRTTKRAYRPKAECVRP
jgi:late competence protein required for DNA uptake (superfamily II DNA/RNA helicase)